MPMSEHPIQPRPETPVEDYLEQQHAVGDEAGVDDAATADSAPPAVLSVEANEADVVEQSIPVPLDDDYPEAED